MKKSELLKAIESAPADADIIIGFTMSKEALGEYPGQSVDEKGNVVYTVEKYIGGVEVDVNTVWLELGEDYQYKGESK